MDNVQYRVKRSFSYGDRKYKQGDIWTPDGGKWDAQIISGGLVVTERIKPEAEAESKAAKRGTQGR